MRQALRAGMDRRILSVTLYALLFLLAPVTYLTACTLWGATGARTKDGGTLIAKNRDKEPSQHGELRTVVRKGHRFLGLYYTDVEKRRSIAGGINDSGLCLLGASAGSVPREERNKGGRGLSEHILTSFDSVDAVLKNQKMFAGTHPVFYIIGDRSKIATVEVAPGGKFRVRSTDNGILCHTNHYLDEKLLRANDKIGTSSLARLKRIQELMTTHASPFTLEDFITFSEDRHDGPDRSIWRTGSTPDKERTLATWIASIPKNGSPALYVKLANTGEPERTYNLKLDSSFWATHTRSDPLHSNLPAGKTR
jgi:isopenicillin-N N-acyltransferase like protein